MISESFLKMEPQEMIKCNMKGQGETDAAGNDENTVSDLSRGNEDLFLTTFNDLKEQESRFQEISLLASCLSGFAANGEGEEGCSSENNDAMADEESNIGRLLAAHIYSEAPLETPTTPQQGSLEFGQQTAASTVGLLFRMLHTEQTAEGKHNTDGNRHISDNVQGKVISGEGLSEASATQLNPEDQKTEKHNDLPQLKVVSANEAFADISKAQAAGVPAGSDMDAKIETSEANGKENISGANGLDARDNKNMKDPGPQPAASAKQPFTVIKGTEGIQADDGPRSVSTMEEKPAAAKLLKTAAAGRLSENVPQPAMATRRDEDGKVSNESKIDGSAGKERVTNLESAFSNASVKTEPKNNVNITSDNKQSMPNAVTEGAVEKTSSFDSDKAQLPGVSNTLTAGDGSEKSGELKTLESMPKPAQREVVSQVVKKAVLSFNNGQTQVKIDVEPESLGRIRMNISTEKNQVLIKIVADVPLTRDILESNISQLKAELQNQGLEIEKVSVTVSTEQDRYSSDPHQKEFKEYQGKHEKQNEEKHSRHQQKEQHNPRPDYEKGANVIDFFA